jgi:malonate transporter MadL subunit
MKIYGVALLAACMIFGHWIGDLLATLFGMNGNLGGVGFAMLLLVLVVDYSKRHNLLDVESESGLQFWGKMYIPVVVAMSATQNVKAAVKGGWLALIVGVVATVVCYCLIPFFTRMITKK